MLKELTDRHAPGMHSTVAVHTKGWELGCKRVQEPVAALPEDRKEFERLIAKLKFEPDKKAIGAELRTEPRYSAPTSDSAGGTWRPHEVRL
jgi:hypothetical protein